MVIAIHIPHPGHRGAKVSEFLRRGGIEGVQQTARGAAEHKDLTVGFIAAYLLPRRPHQEIRHLIPVHIPYSSYRTAKLLGRGIIKGQQPLASGTIEDKHLTAAKNTATACPGAPTRTSGIPSLFTSPAPATDQPK